MDYSSCDDCVAGKSNNQPGSSSISSCTVCSAGKYSYVGQACHDCPEGYFLSDDKLDVNKHKQTKEISACNQCLPKTFSNAGSKTCKSCVTGRYRNKSSNSFECENCPIGQYRRNETKETCDKCGIGFYQDKPAETYCRQC